MRNKEKEEIPLVNIERNPMILVGAIALSALSAYAAYTQLKAFSPWGFVLAAPALMLFFQALWFMLNPFAIVFEDKLEIKQTFFHHKDCYFIDIKQISLSKEGKVFITYRDDEIERLNLFGIKASHAGLMKNEVEKLVNSRFKI